MNEVAQKEYQDLLDEVHKIEETSAAIAVKLRGLGKRLVDFGRVLEKIDTFLRRSITRGWNISPIKFLPLSSSTRQIAPRRWTLNRA